MNNALLVLLRDHLQLRVTTLLVVAGGKPPSVLFSVLKVHFTPLQQLYRKKLYVN